MGKREERNTQGPASKLVFSLTITYMYVTVLFRNQTHIPIALMTTGALPKHRQVIFQAQVDNRQYLHAAERSQCSREKPITLWFELLSLSFSFV